VLRDLERLEALGLFPRRWQRKFLRLEIYRFCLGPKRTPFAAVNISTARIANKNGLFLFHSVIEHPI
jgi:hypothetical protein